MPLKRLWIFPVTAAILTGCSPSKPSYPPTEKRVTTERFGDTTVQDDYRWLENRDDPAVKAWVASQNAFTRSWLEKVHARGMIAARLKELYGGKSVSYRSAVWSGKLFVLKSEPPKEQPFLVALDSANDVSGGRIVIDPNAIDSTGSTSMDFFVPSNNGKLVAASLSRGGSEDGTAYVFETQTGKRLPDEVPRVNYPTAGGSIAWNAEGTGFYYTRYPQGSERPAADQAFYQEIYYHKLGTPAGADRYVTGKDFPKIAEISLSMNGDGKYMLARVANGDGGEFAFFLMGPGSRWTQITQYSDSVSEAEFGAGGKLYLLTTRGAPRGKVVTVPLARPRLADARTVIPESDGVIRQVLPGRDRIYTLELIGGPSRVRIFDGNGLFRGMFPTAPIASITELTPLAGDRILYGAESYLENFAYYVYDPKPNGAARTLLAGSSPADFSDCEVVRDTAVSRDGTRIPMSILRRKGTALDGKNPVILYGYGGFDRAEMPAFSVRNRLWLDAGGVFVDANLRGGSEFGEAWHGAGKLLKKQNVFDDFIACAERLIGENYTSAGKLAIEGWSNGGLLMGAALTQRPDLFRAVVGHSGLYDMLHFEQIPNGVFNVTEFGSTANPVEFRAIAAYSPYQHVVNGTKYPAMLLLTGDNDGRVSPANSRKMAARLQEASDAPYPVLLRTSSAAGHGFGSALDEVIGEDLDLFSFLFDQLGIQYAGKEAA